MNPSAAYRPSDQGDPTVPTSPCSLPVGTRLEEFEVIDVVGQGGFGIVYRARDHMLEREVALKEYMPSALAVRSGHTAVSVKSEDLADAFTAGLKSFVNEAKMLARFDHPSLVKVYRFWEASGTAYMVMPLYEGGTMRDALRALGGPPTELWLKDLLRPLLDVLAYLHRAHCFHRDIAPDNIWILPDGQPLLLDFGAARRVIGDMTRALTVILKPGYAPIEQYGQTSEWKQGPWTDIYALASVMYFAITGKAPLPSVARMMSDSLALLTPMAAGRYSAQFLSAIDKALAVTPTERPQDIGEFRALLGLDGREAPRTAPPALKNDAVAYGASSARLEVTRGSHPWGLGPPRAGRMAGRAVTVTALAAAIAGAWFFFQSPPVPLTAPPEPVAQPAEEGTRLVRPDVPPAPTPAPPVTPLVSLPSPGSSTPADGPPRQVVKGARPGPPAARRCSDILERVSLGEPLTLEEQRTLRRDC